MVFRVVVLSLALGACVQSEVVQCEDGRTCPVGTRCVDNPRVCASDEQLTACDGHSGGDGCTTHAGLGLCNGAALGETCATCVCLEARCGDGFLTAPEDCDGDVAGTAPLCNQHGFYEDTAVGCTAACEYNTLQSCSRKCGDGVVEAAFGEICDDSVAPLEPCMSFGYDIGFASCIQGGCSPDVRECRRIGWSPVVRDAVTFYGGSASVVDGHIYVLGDATNHAIAWHHDGISWSRMDPGVDMSPSAIWAASPNDIYIVGGTGTTARSAHFNGTTWTSEDLPIDAATSVYGTASNDVWIFGAGSSRHFDGTSWSVMPSVTTPESIWASGASDYWFVNTAHQLVHYNGTSWGATGVSPAITVNAVSGTGTQVVVVGDANVGGNSAFIQNGAGFVALGVITAPLDRVLAVSPTDVFATGDGGVYHYDGAEWTLLDNASSVVNITGIEPDRIFEIQGAGAINRYNGNAWETRATPSAPSGQYASIVGGPQGDVFVARSNAVDIFTNGKLTSTLVNQSARTLGRAGDDVYVAGSSLIDRYTGNNTWAPDTAPPVFFNAISGTDASHVYAITFNTVYARNADATWTLMPTPPIASGTGFLDLYCVPNTSTCAAVGQRTIGMLNGTTWTITPLPNGQLLSDAWGSAANDIYAAGSAGPVGALLHYDGSTWTPVEIAGEGDAFVGVFGTAANDVFVVTRGEQLYHYDGAHWSPVRKVADAGSATATDLWVSAKAIWTVGSMGLSANPLRISILERTFQWD